MIGERAGGSFLTRVPCPVWAILALVAVHLVTLLRYPSPFTDEAWFASRAIALAETGCAFGPLDRGVFERFPNRCRLFPWLPTALQALALSLVGDPLLGVRLVSLASGAALLFAIASVAGRLGGPQAAWIAPIVTGTSQAFAYSAHLGRYDTLCAALGWTGIALILRGGALSWLLAGLAAGLSIEVHAHGAIYPPLVLLAHAVAHGWRRLFDVSGRLVAAGLLAAGCVYLALHVLPDPESFFAFQRLAFSATHTPPLATLDLTVMLQGLADQYHSLGRLYLIPLPILAVTAALSLWRRTPRDKLLLALSASTLLAGALLVRNKAWYYRLLFSPALDLIIAFGLARLFPGTGHSSRAPRLVRDVALALTAAGAAAAWAPLAIDGGAAFRIVEARLATAVRPGERVMGAQLYWLGLRDRDYYSWEQLVYYRRANPGATLDDALRAFRPDALILDTQLASFVLDAWETDEPYRQELRIPRRELDAFLARRAQLAGEFGGPDGRLYLFRIRWD